MSDPLDDREFADDIELSRRIQIFCAWCGPGFVILLFGGWGVMGGFIPLISGALPSAAVAADYADHVVLHKFGAVLGLLGTFLTIPFFLVISIQMRRTERRVPILSILQFASGIIVTVVLTIPMLLFIGGQYRPERSPELTQLVNDLSYVMLILPWPPILGQLFSFAMAIFTDGDRTHPVFPRWLGYFNLWVAVFLLPATLIIFFRDGVFAWTGLVGFWLPAAVFGVWYLVVTRVLIQAINDEARQHLACGEAGSHREHGRCHLISTADT